MATDSKTRPNRQSTISFTLPLSCQICLGKVKQPVLCPNHHVFCQLCMDIWLEKNKQCPTCRVDISEENPVRTIIGGQLEEEDKTRQSTAEIRRVRFELLYREYEDQFEQMNKELIILRTENNILAAQLKDAEEENEGHRKAEDKQQPNSSAKDGPNLLLLTQNLQEAQKLYTGIKGDMASLKEENGKLKEENINLTRENETLRLEIAQRSPKKFGRYTVATLEAKVSDLEKENRQLKNALQRSDTYIEDLEKQVAKISNLADVNHVGEISSVSGRSVRPSDKTPRTDKYMDSDASGLNQNDAFAPSSSSVKRALFNKSSIPSSTSTRAQSLPEFYNGQPYVSEQDHLEKIMETEENMPSSTDVNSGKQPESIMKNSVATTVSKSGKCGRDQHPNERGSKKVKFDIQGDNNVSSSFDLEMPSPYFGVGGKRDSPNSSQEGGKSINNEVTTSANVDSESNNRKSVGPKSSSAFDEYITNLLEKSSATSYHRAVPNDSLKTDNNNRPKHNNKYNNGRGQESQNAGDGSYLSIPDLNISDKMADLSDNEHYLTHSHSTTKSETGDLNISMTPELSDCLQLMTQAERKLEQTPGDTQFFPERERNALKHAQQDLSHLSLSKQAHHQPLSLPQSFHSSLNQKNTPCSSYIPAADDSWKQKFFSTLSANPYKFNPSVASLSRSQPSPSVHGNGNVNTSDRTKSLASSESALTNLHNEDSLFRETVISSVRPPSRGSLNDLDSRFISMSQPSSNLFRPASSSSSSNVMSASALTTNLTGDGASSMTSKSYSLHDDLLRSSLSHDQSLFSFPSADVNCPVRLQPPPPSQPSSSASSLPFSSLYNLAPNSSNGLSSTSSLHNHIDSVHSQSLYPTSSLAFSNPLPPSLNNSALEWPEDLSNLSMPRSNGVGDSLTANGSDIFPVPSHGGAGLGHKSGSISLRNGKHHMNSSYISSSLVSDESSFQLPEPKKRLFNNSDDDLELPSAPLKTTKR